MSCQGLVTLVRFEPVVVTHSDPSRPSPEVLDGFRCGTGTFVPGSGRYHPGGKPWLGPSLCELRLLGLSFWGRFKSVRRYSAVQREQGPVQSPNLLRYLGGSTLAKFWYCELGTRVPGYPDTGGLCPVSQYYCFTPQNFQKNPNSCSLTFGCSPETKK